MKYSQSAVLVFGGVAAILGIYFADTAPYTNIAAAAVCAAAVIGLTQVYRQAKDAEYDQQIVHHLVRSIPPSPWWKDRVNEAVQAAAPKEWIQPQGPL